MSKNDGAPPSELRIASYNPSYKGEVVSLIHQEYGGDLTAIEKRFCEFYEHPFQRDRAIRLVAVEGARVVGFQSVFYWPYRLGSQVFNVYQSGNSIIAKDWRGRRVFGRLLKRLDEIVDATGVDFLVGFPVDASLGSFLRREWTEVISLEWRVKLIHPLSPLRLRRAEAYENLFESVPKPFHAEPPRDAFVLAESPEFAAWRSQFRTPNTYGYFHYGSEGRRVRFDLRLEERGRLVILVIGGMKCEAADHGVLREGLQTLLRHVRKYPQITMVAIAFNPHVAEGRLKTLLKGMWFFPLRQKIHFVAKAVGVPSELTLDRHRWVLYRSDIDTW